MILKTERLILRPFNTDDFDAVHSYASVIENVKYTCWGPNDEAATEKFIRDNTEHWSATFQRDFGFAITLKDSGKVIGGCGLELNDEFNMVSDETGTLGWILHRDYWKQGYTPEAASALLKLGFERLALHRIVARCNADNYGSYRVMEKIGMRREAHFKSARFGRVGENEVWYDELIYAILKDEWNNL